MACATLQLYSTSDLFYSCDMITATTWSWIPYVYGRCHGTMNGYQQAKYDENAWSERVVWLNWDMDWDLRRELNPGLGFFFFSFPFSHRSAVKDTS